MFLKTVAINCVRNQTWIASSMRLKHTLPELDYDFKALEPVISRDIMEVHYTKHHQTYVNNLNVAETALEGALKSKDITKVISLQNAIRFNGGGHINHTIFWKNLTPKKTEPSAELKAAIEKRFTSVDNFKKQMTASTVGIQGSGWGWFGINNTTKQLEIIGCPNQDPLQATTGLTPLFGIDVWEHAYYLQYKNLRQNYVEAIFDIINWEDVNSRFSQAK